MPARGSPASWLNREQNVLGKAVFINGAFGWNGIWTRVKMHDCGGAAYT